MKANLSSCLSNKLWLTKHTVSYKISEAHLVSSVSYSYYNLHMLYFEFHPNHTLKMGQVASDDSSFFPFLWVRVHVEKIKSLCVLEGLLVTGTRVSGADANE